MRSIAWQHVHGSMRVENRIPPKSLQRVVEGLTDEFHECIRRLSSE